MLFIQKKSFIVFLAFLFILNTLSLFPQSESESLTFLWAFVYQDTDGKINTIDPVKAEARFSAKDKFKIFLKPVENVYIYLYLLDAQNTLSLVFPEYLKFFQQGYGWGINYHIPEGNNWFYLDENSGTEEFYLLASSERLLKLEQLTDKYITLITAKLKNKDDLALLQHLVLDEIKRLRLEGFSLLSPPERPIPVAGNFRGVGQLTEILATEVSAHGLYIKTIRLIH